MRHGRAKAARKTLQFYSLNGGIKGPYHVLCDGNFLAAAVRQKVPLHDRISTLLQKTTFFLHVTRSTLDELASLPGEVFAKARQFGLDECEIVERDAIPERSKRKSNDGGNEKIGDGECLGEPGEDIRLLVMDGANRHGYLIGTQDEALSDTLRGLPYVPQIRLSRGVLLLEAPSAASRRRAKHQERNKMITGGGLATKEEREMVAGVREKERSARKRKNDEARRLAGLRDGQAGGATRRAKKKAKGPNPLSCKKSGRATLEAGKGSASKNRGDGETDSKRRRRRK